HNSVWFATSGGVGTPSFTILTNAARTTGVQLAASSIAWSSVSDINIKENLVELNYSDILNKVESLPIYQYNIIGSEETEYYRGPTAQDWHNLFPSSKDNLKIDTVDLDGITLSALKGLLQKVKDQDN